MCPQDCRAAWLRLGAVELAGLTVEHIQQRDGRWVLADLVGKGGRVRTVAVPAWVKVTIDQWAEAAGIESGRLWRSINRGGRVWGDGHTKKDLGGSRTLHR